MQIAQLTVYYSDTGPAESVQLLWFWPDQFFLKVKANSILQNANNKQSASVIVGLIRLFILSCNK